MKACTSAGHWPTALELFQELRLLKNRPDGLSWNAAMSAAEAGGELGEGAEMGASKRASHPLFYCYLHHPSPEPLLRKHQGLFSGADVNGCSYSSHQTPSFTIL